MLYKFNNITNDLYNNNDNNVNDNSKSKSRNINKILQYYYLFNYYFF